MPASLVDMRWYTSTSGLGGAITGSTIGSQTATLGAAITGVAVADAAGNAYGVGALRFVAATKTFYYTAPGGIEGSGVTVAGSGDIDVLDGGAGGYLRLTITFGSLPGADTTQTVTLATLLNAIWDDVTKAQALAGLIEYRCIYLKNTAATSIQGAAVWIQADSIGADVIAIGFDAGGVGATAVTIANEGVAPAGVTFTQPASEAAALSVGTMTTGQAVALWLRRTVPLNTFTVVADDYSWLKFRILI